MKNLAIWTCVFLALVVLIAYVEGYNDTTEWNNGECPCCGGHWELFDVEHTKSDVYYYYKCECGEVIRLYTEY